MTGTPEGSTESGFMEKPGIEPATPGLQGIALIPVIDLHLLVVCKLGGTGRSFLLYIHVRGGRWLSGRVLDSRPRGRGFETHRRHCYVSLSKTHWS